MKLSHKFKVGLTVTLATLLCVLVVRASTITTILGTDTISSSRTVINTNFSNLNTDKLEKSGGTLTGNLIGTGASFSAGEFTVYASASKYFGGGLSSCSGTSFLQWTLGLFGCAVPAGGSSNFSGLDTNVTGATQFKITSLSFDANMFDFSNVASAGTVKLDWTNGPASRSATQSITGLWTFGNVGSATFAGSVDVTKSITSSKTVTATQFIGSGTASNTFAGSLDLSKGLHAVNVTSSGIFLGTGTGSNSFSGSLNITKSITAGGLTITSLTNSGASFLTGKLNGTTASFSAAFEIATYASASAYKGNAFPSTNCTGSSFLQWSTTGIFTCGTPAGGGGGTQIELSESLTQDTGTKVSSLSFDPGAFIVAFPAGGFVRLDYANGPASRSATQTISGAWGFTAASTQFNTLEFGTASASGNAVFGGTGSSTFAGSVNTSKGINAAKYSGASLSTCSNTQGLTWTSGAFSCVALNFQPTDATLTALAALDSTTGFIGMTGADTFVRRTLTGTSNQIGVTNGDSQTGNPVFSITTPFIVPGRASVSGNFEVSGLNAWASISSRLNVGGASVLPNSVAQFASTSNNFVQVNHQNLSTGSSASFDLTITRDGGTNTTQFLDLGLNNSTYQDAGFTIASKGEGYLYTSDRSLSIGTASSSTKSFLKFFVGGTLTANQIMTLKPSGASVSGDFDATGTGSNSFAGSLDITKSFTTSKSVTATQFQGSGAASNAFAGSLDLSKSLTSLKSVTAAQFSGSSVVSNSFSGSLAGPTTGTLSVGTSNNPLKVLWSNIVQAVVSFFFPAYTGTSLAGTGSAAVKTASGSLDFNDGSVTKVLDGRTCFTYVVDSPTASNPSTVGPKMFDNPFTITSVQPIASGSNAAGWNLVYGAPGSLTTSVFTLNKSASTSTYPTYTSFANSTLTDGQGLAVRITSRSAILQTFSVSVCGRYTH